MKDFVEKNLKMTTKCDFCIIPKEELASLLADSYRLNALEAGGVDNWNWYGESIRDFLNECKSSDETDYESIDDIANAAAEYYLTLADVM